MATIFNWLDAKLFGYRVILDPDGNELPERPALRFLGSAIVTDNPSGNYTEIGVSTDISNATALAIPDTIVKRGSTAGAAFGGTLVADDFSVNTVNAGTITASGLSSLATTRMTSWEVRNSGIKRLEATSTTLQTTIESTLPVVFRTEATTTNGTASKSATFTTGGTTGSGANSGAMQISTGAVSLFGNSGNVVITTGSAAGGTNRSGNIVLQTGSAPFSGDVIISTTPGVSSGSFFVSVGGGGSGGTPGNITMTLIAGATTVGNFVVVGGSNAAPQYRSNFGFTYAGNTPEFNGGAGVMYLGQCLAQPTLGLPLNGMLLWCDQLGNVRIMSKKGFVTLL